MWIIFNFFSSLTSRVHIRMTLLSSLISLMTEFEHKVKKKFSRQEQAFPFIIFSHAPEEDWSQTTKRKFPDKSRRKTERDKLMEWLARDEVQATELLRKTMTYWYGIMRIIRLSHKHSVKFKSIIRIITHFWLIWNVKKSARPVSKASKRSQLSPQLKFYTQLISPSRLSRRNFSRLANVPSAQARWWAIVKIL